ncbi:uncharacterized protein CEXT_500611 [Caerostris extrusa]|uniref:Uncharacterized protein n=1 Tax=Caerostris extrusa TaxID=172846 RepID=A0AAV4XBF0_CAEEX|nr:uncharacterized protein CEXT_500611 [Caerostris extrusa]
MKEGKIKNLSDPRCPQKELRSSVSNVANECNKILKDATTWHATEVHPDGPNSKDTFWRDFNEGKISVSDKDMYSKVKERAERAARTISVTKGGKIIESGQKENPSQLLCPKVVLKRKPVNRTCESLSYKSSFKVKPVGLQIRKRKSMTS